MASNDIRSRAVIVPASAGSGKTYRIAHEYIYDVLRDRYDDNGNPYFDELFYKRILAVTFTNKATEEMKSRILKEIHLLAAGEESDHLEDLIKETGLTEATLRSRAKIIRSRMLHDYSHFMVLTNDTFFQRILRAFVRELSIDINFTTELDTAPVLNKSIEALIESITKEKELQEWLEELTAYRIREGERWDIRSAITSLTGELFKESTRDIIEATTDKASLKKSIDNFESIVNQRRDALKAKGVEACELISSRGYSHDNFKLKFTKIFEKVAQGTLDKITEANARHLTDRPEEWFNKGKYNQELLALAEKLQLIFVDIYSDFTDLQTLNNTLRILSRNYRGFALLHDLQERVNDICRKENSMLLSETKHAISGFISESEAPFIYEKVGNYFDKFMIDEFQDTSAKEWKNFLPLLRNAMSQSEDTSVLIVGDVKQSIYRWRGGDWRILGRDVRNDLPDSISDPLENNWRSLPNIVKFNELLFNSIIEKTNKTLNDNLDKADKAHRISPECKEELYDTLKHAYANHRQNAKRKHTHKGYIAITAAQENFDSSSRLLSKDGLPLYIERIKEILERGFSPRDITILVRKNSEGMEIAEELLSYRSLLPKRYWFEITTEEALSLASSPAVKLIIAVMRLAINRKDITSLVLYNHLHNDDYFGTPISDEDNAFFDSIRSMSLEEAFNHITIRYADELEGQTAYVLALHEHIIRFSTGKVADIALFDKWWREKGSSLSVRVERNDRTIEILTIHKSKGLENKVIIIPRCSWSLEPLNSSGLISNIVWTKPAPNEHLTGIDQFPVSFSKSVGESLFADGYFRESVYSCVDALNMLYVATTRAKEQLHIFLPQKKRGNDIGTMLLDTYSEQMQDVEGTHYRIYEIGTFDAPDPKRPKEGESEKPEERIESSVITSHRVSPVSLKLSTSSSRYFADEEIALTPRNMGIRLHHVFEKATSRDDIFKALNDMSVNGELSATEVESLQQTIDDTLNNSVAGEWFDGSWQHLYCERNILIPKSNAKRPDRVMVRDKEAVVVDYKFGQEKESHKAQIRSYLSELQKMGYTSTKGYVWYVATGKIEAVEP